MTRRLTEEEKVAKQLAKITNDLTLDLEQVGVVLSDISHNVSFRRLGLIVEVAEQEKENRSLADYPRLW
jgi:hypothetical protein